LTERKSGANLFRSRTVKLFAMNPVLRVLAPKEPPVEYALEIDTIRVGRDESNHIVLKCAQVSAQHLVLRRQREGGDGFRLIDQGSTNGTKVNGVRVREVVLRDGDEILIGGTVVAIYSESALSVVPRSSGSAALPPARPPVKIAKPGPPPAAGMGR
jgi:pSer/pThr/pTyr-binding forkhead associated (FHA) protein